MRKTSIKSIIYRAVLWLLCSAALNVHALATDFQHMETRYGRVDVIEADGTVSIQYRGKVILKAEADVGSLIRVTSESANEYVIANFSHGGLHCRGFFHLIELSGNGAVKVSQDFGECYELSGAGFLEANPVVHLKQFIEGKPAESISFLWRDGKISKVFESHDNCRALSFSASSVSKKVPGEKKDKRVGGDGRLQFYFAPDENCAARGVFILAGEKLTSTLRFEDYAYVTYTNPKTSRKTEGWVLADRLIPQDK